MSSVDDLENDPAALNWLGTVGQVGGNWMSAISHWQFGLQAQQAGQFQAAQLRENANQAQAASQRTAFDIQRQSQYIMSNALATAAASGGGASDPTVVNLIARNSGEMAYRQAVALFQGQDRARLLESQAQAKEFEGANVRSNSNQVAAAQLIQGGTNLLKGAARGTMLQRYGLGGPVGLGD